MKRGRPRKQPVMVFGLKFWRCPEPPFKTKRTGHLVPERKMSRARGHVHTYCRGCAAQIAERFRNGETT
jgi:hypothetical protein